MVAAYVLLLISKVFAQSDQDVVTAEIENPDGSINIVIGTPEDMLKRAQQAVDGKDYKQAESRYRGVLAYYPHHARTHIDLANLLRYGMKRYTEAIEEYRKAIESGGTNKKGIAFCHELIGEVYLNDLAMPQEAIEEFKKSIESDPANAKNPSILFNLTVALKQSGRTEEALEYRQKTIKAAPESDLGLMARGELLANEGKHEEALLFLEKARERLNHGALLPVIDNAIKAIKQRLAAQSAGAPTTGPGN